MLCFGTTTYSENLSGFALTKSFFFCTFRGLETSIFESTTFQTRVFSYDRGGMYGTFSHVLKHLKVKATFGRVHKTKKGLKCITS